MRDLNFELIKELIAKKYDYADFIFKEVLPSPTVTNIQVTVTVPHLAKVSDIFSHEEQVYDFVITEMYTQLIKDAVQNFEKETKAWFSFKFAEFSFSEIIRKVLLALNEGNYKFIILPKRVYNMFLSSEMNVYANMLRNGNFNKTKIKFNSIVPPFFKDKEYDYIDAHL